MKFQIKKLTKNEFKTAKDLFNSFQIDDGEDNPSSASDEYLKDLLARDDFHVLVAIVDEKVIGGLTAYELRKYKREETEMFLYEMGVDEPFRRMGIATALIDYLKTICKEKRIPEMFVDTWADNIPAKKLYEKTGGEAEEVIEFTYELD